MRHTSMTATRGHIVCTILDLSVRIAIPRERSRTTIASLGHNAVARRARLLAKSGYFITGSFSRSSASRPRSPGSPKYRYFTKEHYNCFGHSYGRGAQILILRELSYGNLSA